MAKIQLALFLMFIAGNLVCAQGNCDASTFEACPTDGSDYCSYFKCIDDNVLNNAACPDTLKQAVKQRIESMKIEYGVLDCSVGSTQASPQGSCDQTTLNSSCPTPAATASDYCSVIQTYFKCVDDNILNNAACPDIVKQSAKQSIDSIKGTLGSLGCSVGNSGSVIVASVLSLALSGTACFLMIFK